MGTLLKNVPSIIQYWSLRGHKCTFWLTERVQSDLKQKKEQICTIWRGTCSIQSNCSIIGLLVVIVEVFRTIIIIVILLLAFYYWQHLVLAQCEAWDYFVLQICWIFSSVLDLQPHLNVVFLFWALLVWKSLPHTSMWRQKEGEVLRPYPDIPSSVPPRRSQENKWQKDASTCHPCSAQ